MDVRLSDEQVALRDAAAQVARRLGPETVPQLDDVDRRARLDEAVEASGWRELRVPEASGEPLASGVEVCLIAEELARRLGTINYEITCGLTGRVRRVYHRDGEPLVSP